jgi:hypothetical protein
MCFFGYLLCSYKESNSPQRQNYLIDRYIVPAET